jgi:CheY-like chemotaxis protein
MFRAEPQQVAASGDSEAQRVGPHWLMEAKDMRVLVVEDDRDCAESLAMLLRLCGYQVVIVHTCHDGLAEACKLQPQIVLCDIGLPDGDGYTVASVLRQTRAMTGARLIAVTAYGEARDSRRARAAGFDAYLIKPVDPKVLLGELATTL